MPVPSEGDASPIIAPIVLASIGATFAVWYFGLTLVDGNIPLAAALLCAAYVLQIVLHEMGHLVAGLASKYVFLSIAVRPFVVERAGKGLRARVDWKVPVGLTRLVPPIATSRGSMIAFSAAGIAANLGSALVAGSWFVFAGGVPDLSDLLTSHPLGPPLCFAEATTIFGLNFAVRSAIPSRKRTYRSDGARLFDEIRANDRYLRSRASALLQRFNRSGRRSGDGELLLGAARLPLDFTRECMLAHLYAYVYRGVEDAPDEAERDLEVALASSAYGLPAERLELMFHAAIFLAFVRRDASGAERWAALFGLERIDEGPRLQYQAGLAWARGDAEEAYRLGEAFRARLPELVAPQELRDAADATIGRWLERVRAELPPAEEPPAALVD